MELRPALARRVVSTLLAVAAPLSLNAQQLPFVTFTPPPPAAPVDGDFPAASAKTMVDPTYATMYGGSGYDEMFDQATSGNRACMVGVTNSTDLVLFSAFQTVNAGGFDGWVGCGDAETGIPSFATYFGSDGDETIFAADIEDDTLFVVGVTTSVTLPGTDGAYQDSGDGGQDCFVSRMSAIDGSGLKTTLFGKDGAETCSDIVATPRGVWISGTTSGMVDLVNPLQSERKGPSDAMFALLTTDLSSLEFATLFGGDGSDGATAIGVIPVRADSEASKFDGVEMVKIVSAGWTDGGGLPVTENAYKAIHLGGDDGFAVSFFYNYDQLKAQYDYASYLGGTGNDVPTDIYVGRHSIGIVGWTTVGGWNTVGRERINGSSDGFLYVDKLKTGFEPTISYVGPSSSYNLPLAVAWDKLGITAIGGYAVVPSHGTAFLQALDRSLKIIGSEYTGGNAPADCNTIRVNPWCWACGGKTSAAISTTALAIQSTFKGNFDMFGAAYPTPWSYSFLYNLTDAPLTGTKDGETIDSIGPRSPRRVDMLSWYFDHTYLLSGAYNTYEINRTFDETTPLLSYTYVFKDMALRVDIPQVGKGEVGILAYNELGRNVEVYRTDQTAEHNEIKRTTVEPGQFFYVPLPKDQNFGISDGLDFIDFRLRKRRHGGDFPYFAGVLQTKALKGAGSETFELELYDADGDEIEVPITTASEDPEIIPARFALHANHPNPFSQATTLEFEIPGISTVRLAIYDVMGRRVRTLVDDVRAAGTASIEWDGRNDSGLSVASGTYLARLETGGGSITKRMVLAR